MAVQLYAVIQALASGQDFFKAIYPITLASLLASTLSLLLTLLVYIASDRLHEEGRRVVWVGYIAMFLWHLMMVTARVSVLVMFAHTFGFYVSIVVGVHWIITLIWLLLERTNFCGESTSRPPKRRFYFEIPFAFLLSFVFLFIYFNVKDSSSLVRSIVYHLLTAIETAILASLFYAFKSTLWYTPWWFGFTVGFYLIGIAIMSLYYCAWHPNRTDNCYMIGLPKHCCGCCSSRDKGPAIGNVDLPLRDTSSSSGGEDRITPTINVQEEDAHTQRTGQTPDRLTITPVSSSAYNRLDPTPGRHDRNGSFLPLSSQPANLNYSSQSGMLGQRYSTHNGIVGEADGTQLQPYYQYTSANVQRSHSHNQPRPRRETWFRDDRRNSDLPFGSSTQNPYRSVLGGGAAYVSDFAVTRQHLPQYNGYISRPSSGWSGNESGITASSLQRTPSNQYPSRSSTPFPTVQVNGIRDSVTELHQPAVRPRSYGSPLTLHTSSAAYSSSPHIRSHEGIVLSNPASRPQSRGSYGSRNSAHLHLPDSSKRQDCSWIGMSHSRSGGFIPKHSPLLSHHHGSRHYSHGPLTSHHTPSPHTRPHNSTHYREDSTGGCSTTYHSSSAGNDPGRDSRATNDRSTSRSSSSGGEGAYNQRVSGTFDSDGVCDSRVTASILANNYSPPINSISLHSTGGTLV